MIPTHKIPTLAELHQDNPNAYADDKLKTLLNAPVNMAWTKKHPITSVPYLPVDKIDYMLDKIYGRWEVSIKSIFQIENSVVAIITLKVWNPHRNEWDYQDGGGAMPIQVESQCPAHDMTKIKSNAIQLAVPAAISYAKKDAADNLGVVFGRNISRKDTIAWDPSFKEDPFVNQASGADEKTPPPPPPLSETLTAKVFNHTPMDATPGVLAGSQAQAPVVDFTPPAFDASAFAMPVVDSQAEKKQPITQGIDLGSPINF
jgi:hypothetical protein